MKRLDGIQNVQEASDGYARPTAGGYICKITSVEDNVEKEYLLIEYDIAEGEFKDYYKELNDRKGYWLGNFIKSYKKGAWPWFKGFCTAINESNPGFTFDGDRYCNEQTLIGKKIGLVIGEEEYKKGDGSLGSRLYVDKTFSTERIRKGDYKVPEYKHYGGTSSGSGSSSSTDYMTPVSGSDDDSELPFA